MPKITYTRVTPSDIHFVATHMRTPDIEEVWATGEYDLEEALGESVSASGWSATVSCDGEPVAICGVVDSKIPYGEGTIGIPWLLGTNGLYRNAARYLIESKEIGYAMLDRHPKLANRVHAKNEASIRWLEWMGFTVHEEEVANEITGEPFRSFTITEEEYNVRTNSVGSSSSGSVRGGGSRLSQGTEPGDESLQ